MKSSRSLSIWWKNGSDMGSLVLYIIEWAFALIVLLGVYKAVFSGTTLHRFNRFYLLGATLLSALLPLLHLTIPEKVPEMSDLTIMETEFAQELMGTFVLVSQPEMAIPESDAPARKSSLWAVLLVCAYTAYVLVLFTGWTRGIVRTLRFLKGKPRRRLSRTVWLVTHNEAFGPFSWLNYIVISDTEKGFARRAGIRHEYAHIRLMHSLDLIVLLACTILNPACWLVLQEIKIVHEYEADDEVINRYGIREKDYQRLLIMRTVGAEAYALASSFNLNIKKRITMMNKKKTLKRRLTWLLLLIPLLGMTSVLFARTEKTVGPDEVSEFLNIGPDEPDTRVTVIRQNVSTQQSQDDEYVEFDGVKVKRRNIMQVMINILNQVYADNGAVRRVVEMSELKGIVKQFIANPDNDSRLPELLDYSDSDVGSFKSTLNHIFVIQVDRASSAGTYTDVYAVLKKSYDELRDELCRKEFGRGYGECTDKQQLYARAVYPMKIVDATPKQYGAPVASADNGNTGSATPPPPAANGFIPERPEMMLQFNPGKNEGDVNNDLRIAITPAPVGLVTSIRTYRVENGNDVLVGEKDVQRLSMEELRDYINREKTIDGGIRNFRLAISNDTPAGIVTDVKSVLRQMTTGVGIATILYESYEQPDDQEASLFAEVSQTVKAGDVIRGIVADAGNDNPVMLADVYEMDPDNRILAHGITDNSGFFSIKIVDPNNFLQISKDGYVTTRRPVSNGPIHLRRNPAQVTSSENASGSASLDIRFTDPSSGRQMNLTKDINEIPVLLMYDHTIMEKDNDADAAIDLDKGSFSKKELASLLEVKPNQIKAYMIRKGNHATSVYGSRGINGVLEVISPKQYRQLKKEGKLDAQYRLAK